MKNALTSIVLIIALIGFCNAAEVTVDISSHAPTSPWVVLRQIELNVAIKQYEKFLTLLSDLRLEALGEPNGKEMPLETAKIWENQMRIKEDYLRRMAEDTREKITVLIKTAEHDIEESKKTRILEANKAAAREREEQKKAKEEPKPGKKSDQF